MCENLLAECQPRVYYVLHGYPKDLVLSGSLWDWPAHKVKIPKKSRNTPKWCVWAWCAVGFGWESPELRFGRRRASRLTRLVPLQEGNLQGLSAQE